MWQKIALIQLILLVALTAFWTGRETRASVAPARREFTTSNDDGDMVYIWSYDSGKKEWGVTALNYKEASMQHVKIAARTRSR